MRSSFNDKHPELRKGEMFLQNVIDPKLLPSRESTKYFPELDFESIKFKSKRMGNIAYDEKGNRLIFSRPVFVDRIMFELEELKDWSGAN